MWRDLRPVGESASCRLSSEDSVGTQGSGPPGDELLECMHLVGPRGTRVLSCHDTTQWQGGFRRLDKIGFSRLAVRTLQGSRGRDSVVYSIQHFLAGISALSLVYH